ncbi:MAG: hydroxyisourate hydrolase [bacterium]
MSSISTHVLDVSSGMPAQGIKISLHLLKENKWNEIASGATNQDGRITDLFKRDNNPGKGIYKMKFETGDYFNEKSIKNFYPQVEIIFELDSDDHYHIPLLLSPFGYTTYRGS